jgi:hypothetical protein
MPFDSYIYLLDDSNDDRTYYEKLALFNKFNETGNENYSSNVSLIVEKILPTSYIPFLHNDLDNDKILKTNYGISDDKITLFYPTGITADARFKENINNSIKNLDIDRKCYNSFKIDNLIYICIVSWIIIFSLILNIVYYYYKNIYTYIIIVATIVLLIVALIFKMISTIHQ